MPGPTLALDAAVPVPRRGEIEFKIQLEKLQRAYFEAVVAAAGCTIASYDYDDGIDAIVKHRISGRTPSVDAHLEIQLKCTSQYEAIPSSGSFSVKMRNDRFTLFAEHEPSIKKIVVGMIAPGEVDRWLESSSDHLLVRHSCYWTSIRDQVPTGISETSVPLSTARRFDDTALCDIMNRIGKGGYP